jgi:type VI secretion system protein VasI
MMIRYAIIALTASACLVSAQDVQREIARCAAIQNDVERLAAYDALAERLGVVSPSKSVTDDAGKWRLHTDISPMDDSKSFYLSVDAEEPVGTGFRADTSTMMIRFKEGQFDCYITYPLFIGSDSTEVTVRVDRQQPITRKWGISTDHKAIFAPGDARQFVRSLTNAKSLVVRLTPYGESPVTTAFDIRGLNEAMAPILEEMRSR